MAKRRQRKHRDPTATHAPHRETGAVAEIAEICCGLGEIEVLSSTTGAALITRRPLMQSCGCEKAVITASIILGDHGGTSVPN